MSDLNEKMYMNVRTGSVDTIEGWNYFDDGDIYVCPLDKGEIVEVKLDEDGGWIEA